MLAELKSADTLPAFARVIGVKADTLAYVLYIMPPEKKYIEYFVLKKTGGARKICAPSDRLKYIQNKLRAALQNAWDEIEEAKPRKHQSCHGFVLHRSHITNASQHINRRYVLNVDVENFFDNINFGRVFGFFMKDKDFLLPKKAATLISQIAIWNNALPQGSPCSPIISNFIGGILDAHLSRFAKSNRLRYTRYVDDITFSTNEKVLPAGVGVFKPTGEFILGNELGAAIDKTGFLVKSTKTRMQVRGSNQSVTGLVVNQKVNISQIYYKRTRAMCHSIYKNGCYFRNQKFGPGGKTASYLTSLNQLDARWRYILSIKTQSDPRPSEEQLRFPTGAAKQYRKFRFWANFINLQAPLLLCEGKTDNIYVSTSAKYLASKLPALWTTYNGKQRLSFNMFRYTDTNGNFLRLTGGSGPISAFISRYKEDVSKLRSARPRFPVIILIDNDGGTEAIFKVLKKKKDMPVQPSLSSTDPFYYISDNLYLIKTDESSGKTCIEDCFDKRLLAYKIDGKSFNPDKKHEATNEYGKLVFATKVILPQAHHIDFHRFLLIFSRFQAACSNYDHRLATGTLL